MGASPQGQEKELDSFARSRFSASILLETMVSERYSPVNYLSCVGIYRIQSMEASP
jgi:hypothetical protein